MKVWPGILSVGIFLLAGPQVLANNGLSSPNESACTYSDIQEIPMPPLLDQADTQFCYGFTALTLVQELYCEEKVGGCNYSTNKKDPGDQLSVLDALAGSQREYFSQDNGTAFQVLQDIEKRGALAKEYCAPFDTYVAGARKKYSSENWPWAMRNILYALRKEFSVKSACDLAHELKTSMELPGNLEDILETLLKVGEIEEDLFDRSAMKIIAELTAPSTCAASSVKIPSYEVKTLGGDLEDASFLESEVQTKFLQLIKKGTPVGVNICHHSGCVFGWHATTISGYRKKHCPGQPDVLQLKFHDSNGFSYSVPEGQPWTDFSAVFSMQDSFRKISKESFDHGANVGLWGPNSAREHLAPFFWIEKK